MNLPEPQSVTFPSLFAEIKDGTIKIPQFQRDFVWSKAQSAKLLDSIIKGYPIGTFILWKTAERLRSIRNLGGVELPETPKGDSVKYVLDGQQRMTSLFVTLEGLKIHREKHEDDYANMWVDLTANEDEDLVLLEVEDRKEKEIIRLNDLLHGKIKLLASFPEDLQERIETYKTRIKSYQFSVVQIKEAPIDVATEIFSRLNVGGKPLSVFEIMVAKTFDPVKNFDLAEKFSELQEELRAVGYDTIPESTILQTVAMLIGKDVRKKAILKLTREQVIEMWPKAVDAIKDAVDYFRSYYRVPVSKLLPYAALIVPFAYFFHQYGKKPTGDKQKYLSDFFWRASLGGRYSQGMENRLAQDANKIDAILADKLPKYDWSVNVTPQFIEDNGFFSANRAFVKALLCVLAYQQPKSFVDNALVQVDNSWLKQANSKNYHHFFPKAYLLKKKEDYFYINHVANITLVDDFLNKRLIGAKAPGVYMKQFIKDNSEIDSCMKSHLITLSKTGGVLENDYSAFFKTRCRAFSRELSKRIIPQEVDKEVEARHSEDTDEPEESWIAS
jgi:hypothetical protein